MGSFSDNFLKGASAPSDNNSTPTQQPGTSFSTYFNVKSNFPQPAPQPVQQPVVQPQPVQQPNIIQKATSFIGNLFKTPQQEPQVVTADKMSPIIKAGEKVQNALEKYMPQTYAKIEHIIDDPLSKNGDVKQAIIDGWEGYKETVKDEVMRLYKASETPKLGSTSFVDWASKKVSATTGFVGTVFAPLNILFSAAENTPKIGGLIELMMLPFTALGESAPQVSNKIIDSLPLKVDTKSQLKPAVGEVFALATQVAFGKATTEMAMKQSKYVRQFGVDNFNKLTKDIQTKYNPPKTVTIDKATVRQFYVDDAKLAPEVRRAMIDLKLSGSEIKNAVNSGLSINVPWEKVVTIKDKPYWEKAKSIFNVPKTDVTLTETKTQPAKGVAGMLEGGKGDIVPTPAKLPVETGSKTTINAPTIKPTGELPKVFTENSYKYVNVKDFADSIVGSKPTDQVGTLDPNGIVARDPIDPKYVSDLTEKIKAGNVEGIEPVILERGDGGKLQTFDGSNRLTAYKNAGIAVPVIYRGSDAIEGLKRIEEIYKEPSKKPEQKVDAEEEKGLSARELAKNLIKTYVIRGETIEDLRKGGLGSYGGGDSAEIGGYVNGKRVGNDKILVSEIGGKKVSEIFSLKELYDEIKTTSKPKGVIPEVGGVQTNVKPMGGEVKAQPKKLDNKPSSIGEKNTSELGFNPKNLEGDLDSGVAQKETDKIVKRSEIAKNLSKKLNVPIRRGKFNRSALGIYKTNQKVVRIKAGGLSTVFHEVGHYLDDTIGFSKQINSTERTNLMEEYAYSYEGDVKKQQQEAFAEYLRFKMTGQQAKIDKMSPQFDKFFDKKMEELPEIKEVIDTASADFKRWQEQPAIAKILSQISIGGQEKLTLKERVVTGIHSLYTSALDDLHPLSEFSGLAKRRLGGVSATQDPYILARNMRGWVGKADLFLNKGTFGKTFWKLDSKGRAVMDFKGKGYSEIMKPIEKKLDEFRVYLVARRIVEDLAPRGIKTGITTEDAKTALQEIEKKNPEFKKVAEERLQYKDQLMQYAKENGLVGEDGLKKMKELNKFHVPFYRVMEETQARFLGKSKIAGNLARPIKKIKGSEREIIDPLESDVKDTYAIINSAERNNIGLAMSKLAEQDFELGRLFEAVDKPMVATNISAKEILDKLSNEADVALPEDLADQVITVFRPTMDRGANMLNVNFGDTQKVFQVDPDLFKSIQGLNIEDAGIIMKMLSMPAKLLRAGATLTPDFSLRNPLRDQFSALVYSKYGFVPGIDLVRGMFELFKKGDVYNLWKAGGGEHSMMVSLDRESLQGSFKDIMKSRKAKAVKYVKNPVELLRTLSELGEQGTRLGEMRNAIRSGADPVSGAFASREVTLDFARIGAKTRAVNMIVAFWNANMQGMDKMIRSFKTKPLRTLFKTTMGITLPSILLYFANRDDKRWKEIPAWQKNLFWIVLTKDHIVRIPKPFELGVIFGSVPERVLEYIDTKDPKVFDDLKNAIASGATPGFIPTGLLPILENITNYSFFMGRPIVSRGQEALPAEAQAGAYTSEVAKIIGTALSYSPSKIDNLIQGYTGGLGKYTVSALDDILKGTNIVSPPPSPSKNFEDTPVLKAFMIRNPVGTSSESVNRIYDMYGKTTAELNYVKKLVKEGDTDSAKSYVKKHPEVANAALINTVVSYYSDLNKTIDMIRKSKDMTPDQKRDKINKIQELQTDMAQRVLKQIQ